MRKPADWMVYADDRILEFLDEFGNHQPSQIADKVSDMGEGIHYHRKYVGKRCRILAQHGLLENLGNGVYTITQVGQSYLRGEIDVGNLQ